MDVTYREYRPDEAAAACEFTERIFGPLPLDYWLKEPNYTASMAFRGDELVGVIPLSIRQFQLAPGLTAATAWENAVGAREDLRGLGLGTGMIHAAREFLADRCEFLSVYRGAERSAGYRFYAEKTDHVDLAYVCFFRLHDSQAAAPAGFESLDQQAVSEQAELLVSLFHSHWGRHGGYAVRDAGCYPWLIDNIIHGRIPAERSLHLLSSDGMPQGFAITSERQGQRADGNVLVMDLAARDGDRRVIDGLLDGLAAYAAEREAPLVFPTTLGSGLEGQLDAHGFVQGPRRMMLMAWPIHPDKLFAKLVYLRGGCDVTVDVWTPDRDLRVWDAGETAPTATLEMKDRELCLALSSRLDGASALAEQRITVTGPAPRDKVAEAVSRLFCCTPWFHPYLDWL